MKQLLAEIGVFSHQVESVVFKRILPAVTSGFWGWLVEDIEMYDNEIQHGVVEAMYQTLEKTNETR